MKSFHRIALCSGLSALSAISAAAQSFETFPVGARSEWGGSGNTIPFWGGSATYQQVFDLAHMSKLNAGNVIVINQMFFRARGTVPARSATVELKFNHTSVDSTAATTTFASNLQAPGDTAPTTVISSKPLNFPAFNGSAGPGVPGGMNFPLDTIYIWNPFLNKHFIYELRYKDGNPGVQNSQLDAIDGNSYTASRRPSEGTGCTASDKTTPASAFSSLGLATGSSTYPPWTYTVGLANARTNAVAVWFLGLTRQTLTLPGACGSLLVTPIVTQFGMTSQSTPGPKPFPGGTWDIGIPVPMSPDVRHMPRFELLSQFAFDDPALPYGVGLSPMTVVQTNLPGAASVARIYSITTQAGNGAELATTGAKGDDYGLVTGFR